MTEKQQARVEEKAQAVLSARELFPASTLADLYDPLSMPKELLKAHRELDEVVDACYRRAAFKSELERLEYLFELYARYAEPLAHAMAQKPKRTRRGA
ncbi:MAG: type IIL restriction-modification enzyme MmeI [Chlorobaculum sp.]